MLHNQAMNPNQQSSLMNTLGYGNGLGGPSTSPYGPYKAGYKFSPGKPTGAGELPGGVNVDASVAAYNNILKQIAALSAPKPFTYSSFDTTANSARARKQAEGAVNPLYTQRLNEFLGRQNVLRGRAEADATTNQKNLDEALANTLEANKITQERTGQDVTRNLGGIADTQQAYQEDTGSAFDKSRMALLRGADTGSGLGRQEVNDQQAARNTQEGRQVKAFTQAKDEQQLFKTRTFEDLARSGKLATADTGKGKAKNQLDLSRYIQDLAFGEGQYRQEQEGKRLQDILGQQQNYEKIGYSKFLNTLKGEARANTAQVYGGLF